MEEIKKEKILITVKTYPTLSTKYGETVCTAGLREDGTWVRIYPVPFRRLEEAQQYKKFDWVECKLKRNTRDPRPETYRPASENDFVSVGSIGTTDCWRERRELILGRSKIYTNLEDLILRAKKNEVSLAVFKPSEILDFFWESSERQWNRKKLTDMQNYYSQMDLFENNNWQKTFKLVKKLPYNFSYIFKDDSGRKSELQILDWEIGALFWNCVKNYGELKALDKVREKYLHEFKKKDVHFFLGTMLSLHFIAPNPFAIIGVFPIPNNRQLSMFTSL